MQTLFKNLIKAAIAYMLILGCGGCEKDIKVAQPLYKEKPVIECMLKAGDLPKLYLNSSVPYFSPKVTNKNLFIADAVVIIRSTLGNDTLKKDSMLNLFNCQYEYFYKGKKIIQENITYNLTVSISGKDYTAQTTTNQHKPLITGLNYVSSFTDIYGDHEGVIVNFNDIPGESNYYRYQMSRTIDSTVTLGESTVFSICTHGSAFYVKETGRAIYKDTNGDGIPIKIVSEPAYKHKAGAIGYVFMQSMDKNAGEFYEQLDKQKLAQFNPFVEPVFLKPVQFAEAIGVFGTYAVSDSVKFEYPE